MSPGQKAIVSVGAFVITFITVCTFFQNDIKFLLISRNIERKYGNATENSYFIEDNFALVDNYDKAYVNSYTDIVNSIYYLLNSGVTYSERYCAKGYDSCYSDMENVSRDEELLSALNNYVHPYNSFENITFEFDNDSIKITIEHTYTVEEIKEIDKVVKEFVNNKITNNMSTKDKIKTIHDHIINETNYDTLKNDNIKDTTYKSNTAYGVLLQGYGICSGYSDAIAIFLDELNIINYKISNNEHIWNLVYLDGQWLHLDLTWDDPISDKNITRDNYFLISTETLKLLDDDVHYFSSGTFMEAS